VSHETQATTRKRLDSWKEIAEYLERDARTAMRWEEDGLPVRSVPGGQRRGVFAFTDEIDEWLATRDKGAESIAAETTSDETIAVGPGRAGAHRNRALVAAGMLVLIALVAAGWYVRVRSNHDLVFQVNGQTLRFHPVATIPLQGQLGAMTVADLNHDGDPDIVVGGAPTSRLAVLFNQNGKFSPPKYYEGCDSSMGPAVGDFDGDGNPDIAVACNRSREVQVWWGDDNGGFPSSLTMPGSIDSIRCVTGDLNHDGISDFIVDASGGGPMTVYLGHRDRTFTSETFEAGSNPHTPAIADVNGDGNLDILAACYSTGCRNLSLLLGNGDGTFRPAEQFATVGASWAVYVIDLTGDGIADVFTESINGEASLFTGLGQGKFLPGKVLSRPYSATLANAYSDHGHNYVVEMQLYPYEVRVLSFDSQGNATSSNGVATADSARFAFESDYNRDGHNDLAILFMRKNESYVTIYARK